MQHSNQDLCVQYGIIRIDLDDMRSSALDLTHDSFEEYAGSSKARRVGRDT